MSWINTIVPPKIRKLFNKRDVPENLWIKCPETGEMVFRRDLEENHWVIPNSDYHMHMPAGKRLEYFFDNSDFKKIDTPAVPSDPLKFKDQRKYTDRIRDAREKTGTQDAIVLAVGKLNGYSYTVAVQDFEFMGGSLGMAAGEALIKGLENAYEKETPFVLFVSSGGARMQEGILSLMQMPRTTVAVQKLKEKNLPYIVVLTNPTTGGVTASYAMLGDVHIAEPGALICFAGPRVIEQTIREKLPEGFQRAEYLQEHGMIDLVIHRHKINESISRICTILRKQNSSSVAPTSKSTKDIELQQISKSIGN